MDLIPELLDAVRQHLHALGFQIQRAPDGPDRGVDLILTHPKAKKPVNLTAMTSLSTVPRVKLPSGPTVVAAPTVTRKQAALLRAAGAVGFIDAAGNASIETDGIYVHVEGRPPTDVTRAAQLESSRGWAARPTGLQVLFALLTRPALLEARLTDVAHAAGVSATTAHRVLADLTQQGLLDGESMDRFWLNRNGALRAWLEGYMRVVAPRVKESIYVTPVQPDAWKSLIQSRSITAWMTGGTALGAMGTNFRPVVTTIYVPEDFPRAELGIPMARPRSGETPNLFVRRAWWPADAYPPGLVPELLIFADALTSGDPRAITTAQEAMADVADIQSAVAR